MRKFRVWSGLLLLGSCLFADTNHSPSPPATVTASGGVTIDRKTVVGSQNIFPLEELRTSDRGTANISNDGLIASVYSSTKLVYFENGLDLDCGMVQVTTRHSFDVRVEDREIFPQQNADPSVFEVRHGNRKLRVRAIRGAVTVKDGSDLVLIAEQQVHEFTDTMPCPRAVPGWVPGALFAGEAAPILWWFLDRDEMSPSRP